MTLTIEYLDGSPSETIEIDRLDGRFSGILGYVLPGEDVAHGIPVQRIERYTLTAPAAAV